MNKKQRFEAISNGQIPDCMPVFPWLTSHSVYHCGWKLPDITDRENLNPERSAHTALKTYKDYDLDMIHGSYFDLYFGLEALGGTIEIPPQYGAIVSATKYPVEDPKDWPKIKKKFPSIFRKDKRISGFLESTRIVVKEIGDEVPIAVWAMPGATSCVCLIRKIDDLCLDMIEQPDFAYEMCEYANKFSIDFIRRQYDAGANSVTVLGDVFGELISSEMYKKFGLPFIAEVVEVVQKEYNQDVWFHVHGDFKNPNGISILDILVNEIGVKGLHLDEKHNVEWVKKNIADKYKIPTAITYHGPYISDGPEAKIKKDTKEMILQSNPNYCYMATSCEVMPDAPMNHIKTWLQKTHEYSAKLYKSKI